MAVVTININFLIALSQIELKHKLQVLYMTISNSTFITAFSVKNFFYPIYTDYAHFNNKNHI